VDITMPGVQYPHCSRHEGGLHRMQRTLGRQPFHRGDRRTAHCGAIQRAGPLGFPVHQHRARTALAGAAAVLRPGQIEILTQHVQQRAPRREVDGTLVAIHQQSPHHSTVSRRRPARHAALTPAWLDLDRPKRVLDRVPPGP
jgi:hypothetical protein